MDECFVESAVRRLIWLRVSQMPLTEDSGLIAGALKNLSNSRRLQTHALPLENRVGDAGTEFMLTRHQRSSRRSTRGTYLEVREPHTLVEKTIKAWSLDDGIPMGGDVAITLVVCQHEDDIWLWTTLSRGRNGRTNRTGDRSHNLRLLICHILNTNYRSWDEEYGKRSGDGLGWSAVRCSLCLPDEDAGQDRRSKLVGSQ